MFKGVIVKEILYRFADNKGDLKGEGFVQVYCIGSRIPWVL